MEGHLSETELLEAEMDDHLGYSAHEQSVPSKNLSLAIGWTPHDALSFEWASVFSPSTEEEYTIWLFQLSASNTSTSSG